MTETAGTTGLPEIPGYRLEEAIGSGAGGTVYRAVATGAVEDGPPAGTRVAVKVMAVGALRGRSGAQRWAREARLASRIEHPGVVRVLGTGTDDARAWIVMQELSGPDLRARLGSGEAVPGPEAADLVASVADAVAAVHEAGLVHRDLKPANVVLHHGVPTVVDFGLARSAADIDPTGSLTESQDASWAHTAGTTTSATSTTGGPGTAGTFAWMAPEQWRGEEVGAACDVYALGGLLFSALTGQPPYPKETLTELAYSVALDAPPRPSDHGGDARFDGVVAVAMAKDPSDRFPDAAAFAAAVRAVVAGVEIAVPVAGEALDLPAAALPESGRPASRRVPLALGGIGVAVVVVAVLAVLLLRRGDGPATPHGPAAGTVLTVCARDDISLRSAPGAHDDIAEFRHGDHLTVEADDHNDGTWVKVVSADGREGWALTEFSKQTCPS